MVNMKPNLRKITGLSDTMFRGIMYDNKDILKVIMEICTGIKIDNIILLSGDLPKKRFLEMKKNLDVYVESIDILFDIEVSTDYNKWIINRNLAFGFKVYADSVGKGDDYKDYKKTCVLNLISGKKRKIKHSSYLKNEEHKITSDMFNYLEIFVDYYEKEYYNKGNKELINKYKYIIMLGLTLEELEDFNRKYGDEIVKKYTKSFKEMLLAEPFEPLFSREEDERRMRESYRLDGIEIGEKRGEKRGEERGLKLGEERGLILGKKLGGEAIKSEISLRLKEYGMNDEDIYKIIYMPDSKKIKKVKVKS